MTVIPDLQDLINNLNNIMKLSENLQNELNEIGKLEQEEVDKALTDTYEKLVELDDEIDAYKEDIANMVMASDHN